MFLNFHPNRFCFISEPRELVWRSVWSILHSFFGSIFYTFSNFSKHGILFSDFSDSWPNKIGFVAWGRFCMFFVSKNSSNYSQFCDLSINLVWSVINGLLDWQLNRPFRDVLTNWHVNWVRDVLTKSHSQIGSGMSWPTFVGNTIGNTIGNPIGMWPASKYGLQE